MANSTDELVNKISKKRKGVEPKMKKINFETVKTVTIFVLITAIIAFVGGMKYQQHYSANVKAEAKSLSSLTKQTAAVEPSKQ